MEESKKSPYKYCLIVKNRDTFNGGGGGVSLIIIHWKPYATNNNKKRSSLSHDNKVDKYLLQVHNKFLTYQLILYNGYLLLHLKACIFCFIPKKALSWN